MKFNKCSWRLHDGVVPTIPVRTHEIETDDYGLTAFLSTSHDGARGALIGGSLFTVRYTSPMPGVIRVQAGHFKGRTARKPDFDINPNLKAKGTVFQTIDAVTFTSGSLAVRASSSKPWFCDFLGDGRVITSSKPSSLGLMKKAGTDYLREKLSLGIGELIYGLGERFGALVRNWQSIDIWNEDAGTGYEMAYKNIPFYLSSNGTRRFERTDGFEYASRFFESREPASATPASATRPTPRDATRRSGTAPAVSGHTARWDGWFPQTVERRPLSVPEK